MRKVMELLSEDSMPAPEFIHAEALRNLEHEYVSSCAENALLKRLNGNCNKALAAIADFIKRFETEPKAPNSPHTSTDLIHAIKQVLQHPNV